MIKFGSWSTMLGLSSLFGLSVALMLLLRAGNRSANRLLALLLFVAVLRIVPYVIGFAGFYDAYPWLSFAPFDLSMAIGPLLYLYVRRLTSPALPRGWMAHFLPATLDLCYTLWAFSLPLARKGEWNDQVHIRWIDPAERGAAALSLGVYLGLAFRWRAGYRKWLGETVSNGVDHRQPWIGTVLAALGLWLAVSIGFDIVDRLISPLSYFDRFPQYLVFSAIVIGLGLEGWRHAGHPFPMITAQDAPSSAPARDWIKIGPQWAERIHQEEWWREAGLTLSEVARRLGTNETYVSRALNEGVGRNFNAVINGFRVDAVKTGLTGRQGDLLDLALASGFSSKASFNRVFRDHTGLSPSAWRKAQIAKDGKDTVFGTTEGINPSE